MHENIPLDLFSNPSQQIRKMRNKKDTNMCHKKMPSHSSRSKKSSMIINTKRYCSSIFISSLLLVLSSGGHLQLQTDNSCRSCSEALATSFYSHPQASVSTPRSGSATFINRKNLFLFRGGSSLNASTEKDEIEEEKVDGSVNGKRPSAVNKRPKLNKNGFINTSINGRSFQQPTINGAILKMNEKFFDDVSIQEDDLLIPTKNVAETNLPTDVGHFRLRAYRVEEDMQQLMKNLHVGTEPCVIYATDKSPFGKKNVPVRIHDQCFTSEVFRSKR